jgi:hypothetical protein
MFRRFLTLLLSACLALHSGSLALAGETPCPMEAGMQAMVLAGEIDPDELPDCCNDLQTWAETGDLCKTAVDCQGLVTWAPAPAALAVAKASASDPPGTLSTAALQAPRGAPWRPPTAG